MNDEWCMMSDDAKMPKCQTAKLPKIQNIKIYASYENFNALWQGEQFTLKPYPIAQPIFRLSLIWNFYD